MSNILYKRCFLAFSMLAILLLSGCSVRYDNVKLDTDTKRTVLVNYGYREDGLCWQWTRDMAKHIQARNWKSFDFFHGTANRRRYNEHNSLVVTAKGKGVRESMLLDPWRNSGELYWKMAKDDPEYYWTRFTN